ITGLQKQMATWELKNGKALSDANVRKQFDDLYKGLKNGIPESEFDRIQAGFNKIVSSASKAGKTGKTFFEGWKSRMTSLAQYLTTFASFYDVINVLRQAFDAVVQLDSAITELEKVSEASGSRLNQSFENAKKTAQDLGATVTDTINATADWSRIGYSIDQSEQLAEASIIYKNVGDGIDIDTANESLISTLQGFELEASQAMEIVDSFNEVNACLPA
ncbi:MAG: phage tail tape measure protein, partial [Candidatus Pseudoruminococcus sp.]|nr:phage tail tape measure protein [Candidatus Pseudoruminococcus sp.]